MQTSELTQVFSCVLDVSTPLDTQCLVCCIILFYPYHWCSLRGCNCTPKSFDLVKILQNPGKISENLYRDPENLSKLHEN